MASQIFRAISRGHVVTGVGVVGAAGLTVHYYTGRQPLLLDADGFVSAADRQFHTSSMYPVPQSYRGEIFRIKNDYPHSSPSVAVSEQTQKSTAWPSLPAPGEKGPLIDEAPWMRKSFDDEKEALEYCEIVKEYCWEGNVDNGFHIWKNKVYQAVTGGIAGH